MMNALERYFNQDTARWFDLFSEGIVVTNANMIVEYVNASFLDYAGLTAEQIVGRPLPDVRLGSRLPEVIKSKKPLINVARKIDDVESYVDIIPFLKESKLVGALIVVRDKKVLLKLFHKIEKQNEQISEMDQRLKTTFQVHYSFDQVIGREKPFVTMAQKAAQNDSFVLLVGESGTGKEVLAQSIHDSSYRSKGPFIDINCAALPDALLESELFGYSSGSFTGANKRGKIGLFELANGGTLFLDEVTEMSLALQSKLLRVLQEKQLRRLGDNKNIPLDVRVIAATNQNIEGLVKTGAFRADLYFRLAVFVIRIPPLRERRNDIPLFIDKYREENERKNRRKYSFDDKAMRALVAYDWPGNVRQLKNAIEYACEITDLPVIKAEALPPFVIKKKEERNLHRSLLFNKKMTLPQYIGDVEKNILEESLRKYGSGLEAKKTIASVLGISIATLYNKLRKHNLL